MKAKPAMQQLEALGFKKFNSHFATMPAETYGAGRDHFVPKFRDVFIGQVRTGSYITSHICGRMRRYRCRRWDDNTIGNIFGHGQTLSQAIADFVRNFTTKNYNVRRS